MSEDIKDEDIKISEEKDGSATVEVPADMIASEEQEEEVKMADGGQSDDEDDGHDDSQDEGVSDAVREARRARRRAKKEYIKKTNQEKDQRLALLARQNQELMARLAAVEKKTHNSDLARIDKAIQDEENKLNYAKLKMKEATDNSDGQALVRAQELYFETRERIEKIKSLKDRAEQEAAPQQNTVDPVIQDMAQDWMSRNSWYDPNGTDRDSRTAKRIDDELAREGLNPASDDYWDELDARLRERLPHRYTESTSETPRKRGPRSVVTGSERETGGGGSRNTFTLTPEQVRAMKEAGFWDDPKKRAKMVQNYAKYAQSNRS